LACIDFPLGLIFRFLFQELYIQHDFPTPTTPFSGFACHFGSMFAPPKCPCASRGGTKDGIGSSSFGMSIMSFRLEPWQQRRCAFGSKPTICVAHVWQNLSSHFCTVCVNFYLSLLR
jgi:hypothetical protein